MRLIPLLLLCIALSTQPISAQATPGDTTVNPERTFRRLDLPTPSALRTASGEAGPGYWQQRADYVIRATLDTATRSVRGEERITYTNNSPDTLRFVWLQVERVDLPSCEGLHPAAPVPRRLLLRVGCEGSSHDGSFGVVMKPWCCWAAVPLVSALDRR